MVAMSQCIPGPPLLHSVPCFFGCNTCLAVLEDPRPLSLFWASFCCLLQAQHTRGICNFPEPLLTLALVCWEGFKLLLSSWVDAHTLDTSSLDWRGMHTFFHASDCPSPSFDIYTLSFASLEWLSIWEQQLHGAFSQISSVVPLPPTLTIWLQLSMVTSCSQFWHRSTSSSESDVQELSWSHEIRPSVVGLTLS